MFNMKVLLVGNYALDQQRSMLGFAEALRSGLIQKGLNVRVVAPQALAARLLPSRSASNGVRKWLGYFDKFVLFPIALRRAAKWADIVHICDQGNAMYVKHLSRKSQIVTCHDLLAMQASRGEFSGWVVGKSGQKFQQLILSGLKQAC